MASSWEPLPIDRQTDHFKSQLEEVSEQLAIIERDNGYAANEPDERNSILIPAKATVEALREGEVSKDSFLANLFKPMKYLAKKFGDSVIGAAARKIVEIGSDWLDKLI